MDEAIGDTMPGLVIDWMELEIAFESHDPSASAWLDKGSGAIVTGSEPASGTWVRIEAIPSREQYRMMERFIATVTNTALKEALQDAIVGKGAFRRFKDAVGRHADERKRWFAFRDALLHRFILDWLKAHKLELQEIPAWNLELPMTPLPEAADAPISSTTQANPSSTPMPVQVIAERQERADIDGLRVYLQAWARSHGEEYRYLFGPAAFERLASDLTQEFSLTRKRSTP
jgi:hypothetical protein